MAEFLRVANNEALKISEISGISVFGERSSEVEFKTNSLGTYTVHTECLVTTAEVAEVLEVAKWMGAPSVSWREAENALSDMNKKQEEVRKFVEDFTESVSRVFKSMDDFFSGK